MANMNALFRKGYLLAGVVMAANMFSVNEMRAMEQVEGDNNNSINRWEPILIRDNNGNVSWNENVRFFSAVILYCENAVNFIAMLLVSVVNNYFKLYKYSAGKFRIDYGWFGYRTKRFLNGILQFEVGLNVVGKGIPWLIPGIFGLIDYIKLEKYPIIFKSTAGLITMKILNKDENSFRNNKTSFGVFYSIIFLLQGFVYMALTLHISNFSIWISLDAILWELATRRLARKPIMEIIENIFRN